jgi:hypothetical protein
VLIDSEQIHLAALASAPGLPACFLINAQKTIKTCTYKKQRNTSQNAGVLIKKHTRLCIRISQVVAKNAKNGFACRTYQPTVTCTRHALLPAARPKALPSARLRAIATAALRLIEMRAMPPTHPQDAQTRKNPCPPTTSETSLRTSRTSYQRSADRPLKIISINNAQTPLLGQMNGYNGGPEMPV